MQAIAELVQRNPTLIFVIVFGVPSLTWAAAYARRPSRARKRVAIGALVVTCAVALVALLEARRTGASVVPPIVCALVIAALWTIAMLRGRGRR
jgi:4-hydroxybenzoate polyprenyltransferase